MHEKLLAERPDALIVTDLGVHERGTLESHGVPVLYAYGLSTVDAAGKRTPLTHGRIQLQSEGAETWFRNFTVTPIATLPRIVVARRGSP